MKIVVRVWPLRATRSRDARPIRCPLRVRRSLGRGMGACRVPCRSVLHAALSRSRPPCSRCLGSGARRTGERFGRGERPAVRGRCERLSGLRLRGPSGDAGRTRHPRHDHPDCGGERRCRSRRRVGRSRRAGPGCERADDVAPGRNRIDSGHADDGLRRNHPRRPGSGLRAAPPERPGRRKPQGCRARDVRQAELVARLARRQECHRARPARELDEPLEADRHGRVVERQPGRL